jgi:hypothetical protein
MTLITQVDSTDIANQVIPESDRQKLEVVQEWIRNVLATSHATEVEDDEDAELPARKRVKTNNVTHEDDELMSL